MFRSWSPRIPAFTRTCLESHQPKNLFPTCLCFVGWSGLLAPSTFECSKMVSEHTLQFDTFCHAVIHTSGSCGCTWTPFKEVLFSRTLCVSFLAVLIFFLIRTLDFHVWWRLSADCLCSSIVFRFEDETSAHLTYGSRGFEGISSANLFGVED